jgi:hypothetical protein
VTALADYTLVISNPSLSAAGGGHATFNGTLTALNGYNSSVNVNCGAGAPPTCPPTSVTPTAGGAPFTVTVSSNLVQNYNFNIAGRGTDPSTIAHAMAVSFGSTFDFQITNNSGVQMVTAGTSAIYNLALMPLGSTFPSNVVLSCSGLPLRSSCSFNPTQVTAGSGDTPVTLTISTMSRMASVSHGSGIFYAIWLPLPCLVLAFGGFQRRRMRGKRAVLLVAALLLLLVGLQACGGGGSTGSVGGGQPGTPIGDYPVTVTATSNSGSLTHSAQVMLDVQ